MKSPVNREEKEAAMVYRSDVPVVTILGWPIVRCGMHLLLEQISKREKEKDGIAFVACLNPHSLMVAKETPEFQKALRSATYLIPDGVGVKLAAMMFGYMDLKRITGFQLFEAVMQFASSSNKSVFFLGSTPDVLNIIEEKVRRDYGGRIRVGSYSPPFKDKLSERDNEVIIEKVREFGPDILWVGMTSPKQDVWIHDNLHRLPVTLAAGIGAVFDFYAASSPRAPAVMRYIGLEWLFRFLLEPRRMLRRNFVSIPRFITDVIKEFMQGRSSNN